MRRFFIIMFWVFLSTNLTTAFAHADKAHVAVTDAWIRPTVEGQKGTGGFMKLTAQENLQLVRISTPVTKTAEIHEMRASKERPDVMEMRAVSKIDLPKGQAVELKPGGYHLMLMDLTQPLSNGQSVPVTLHFKDSKGASSKLDLMVNIGRGAVPTASTTAPAPATATTVPPAALSPHVKH